MDLRDRVQSSLTGTYTLEHELGGGGMARVFVANEHRFGRRVVVKVLAPELAAALSAERFEREIVLAASLQQANIVPVLSAGETAGLPYYTMPFVEGESLRARLRRGPVPIGEAIAILRDVAKALAYAHERGVVHRDIKPDNILLSGGTAVVTDFGIAKAIAAAQEPAPGATLTQLGTAVGTPAYMAPEQAAGDPATDHRADIYSFGCTAYELIAGEPPFAGLPPHKLIAAHMGETPRPIAGLRPECPATLARLITSCLAKDPADRPGDADELIRALDATTSLPHDAAPGILIGGRGAFTRALALYGAAFLVVAIAAWVLTDQLGLPDWVFTGALIVMALGLPVILFTGYTQMVAHRMATATPTRTPGGSIAAPAVRGTIANLAVLASPHVSWRRAGRGGVLAVGAFALLVAAVLGLRALGIGPEGSLLAAGKLSAQDRVLVASFEGTGADSSLATVISEAVRTNLSQSRAVKVVTTSSIVAALQRMQRPDTTRVDLALAREIAIREGIKAVVSGGIAPAGTGYIITARLVSAESGDELAVYHESADGTGEIIPAVDRLTRKLRGRIGESLREVKQAPALSQVTTPSLPALQAFAAGLRANDVEGDYPRAITLFEEAIARDSAFAAAYVQLAYSLGNAGRQPARQDSLLAKAFQLRERLPERERYVVEGAYYTRDESRDRLRTIASFERAVALDSSNADALNSLAIAYTSIRNYAGAEQMYRRAVAVEPGNGVILANLVGMLITRGKLRDADSVVASMRARRIPYPMTRREAEIQYAAGNLDSAEALVRAMAQSESGPRASGALKALANLAAIRGRLGEHARLLAERSARAGAAEQETMPLDDALGIALLDGWGRGRREAGVARIDSALRAHPLSKVPPGELHLNTATFYALLGAPARARAVVAQFDSLVRGDSVTQRRMASRRLETLAEITLAEGHAEEAIPMFRRADTEADGAPTNCAFCLAMTLSRAYDAAGARDSAIANYERFLATPSTWRPNADAFLLAPTHKRLGELYEQRADFDRAAFHYAKFVELWERADPELQPQVADVRRRLDRVQRMVAR